MAKRKGPLASINPPRRHRPYRADAAYLRSPYTGQQATGAQVPPGFVRFWAPGHPRHAVMVPIGDLGWRDDDTAGWEGTARPLGEALPAWRGATPDEASIDVVFERWEDQRSVQPAFDLLRGLLNKGPSPVTGPGRRPPPVMVTIGATNSRVSRPQDQVDRWVIVAIDIDDAESVKGPNGDYIRVEADIRLMGYPRSQALRDSASTIRKATPKPKPRTYKTRRGDTFLSVAREELHDASRAGEIRDANPKARDARDKVTRDLRRTLKPDQTLKLP